MMDELKKLKKRKGKRVFDDSSSSSSSSSSSHSEDESSSNENIILTSKKKKKGAKNSVGFNYEHLPSNHSLSIPINKLPHYDVTHYTKWWHNMQMHLISLNPSIWKIVCTCVDLLENSPI
jgi:hypothetical protein